MTSTETLIYYANFDSPTAANGSLNAESATQNPTVTIAFTAATNGDLVLESPAGGGVDPDTLISINGGTPTTFTLEFQGYLPHSVKLSNVNGLDLRGERVVVITASTGERLFFLPDAGVTLTDMMNFPNGAHKLDMVTNGGSVLICFANGTRIATPGGEVEVGSLRAGDLVVTADGRSMPILWIGRKTLSPFDLLRDNSLRPVTIPAHFFGHNEPSRPLRLSPAHRIVLSGWQCELLFGTESAMFSARHVAQPAGIPADGITYYHILLEDHAPLIADGLACESFQPGQRGMGSLSAEVQAEIEALFADAPYPALTRPDHCPTVGGKEAQALIGMFAEPGLKVA